jgi:hypothetical protein
MATKRKKPAKTKKVTAKNKTSKKPVTKKKSSPKKKSIRKTVAVRPKVRGKKTTPAKAKPAPKKKRSRPSGQSVESPILRPQESRGRAGGQSGDLQGLSDIGGADSESVDELLEEGNSFEADVVKGVEEAGDEPEEEVHTHEVLEDDVPEEYLDKD